jgi:hypothetical protein
VRLLKAFFCFAVVLVVLAQAFDGEAGTLEGRSPPARSNFVKPVINEEGWAISWPGRERHLFMLNQTRIGMGLVKAGSTDPNTYH